MSMKTRRIVAAVVFAFLPATLSLPAHAQDDAVTVQARARFKEGVEHFDKGRYEDARLSFLQAYTLKRHPSVLLNLAQSSAKSNHPLEAAKYFQQFLKEATTASPAQRKDAEQGLAEVRQKLGRIEVVAPPGTDISIDDQGKVGTTPIEPIDVDVGQHTVKSPTQNLTVVAIGGQKVEARFGSAAAPPPVAPVPTPAAAANENAGPPAKEKPVEGGAKHTNLLSRPENMTPVYIGLVAGGIGLVSAIVFAAFKADAQSKADTVANDIRNAATQRNIPTQGACSNPSAPELYTAVDASHPSACQTLKDNNNKVDTNAMIANVSLVVMGVGLGVAAVWYLAGPKEDDSKATAPTARAPRRPTFTPYAGWNSGGLSVAGEF
jgi:hypothetical protein